MDYEKLILFHFDYTYCKT